MKKILVCVAAVLCVAALSMPSPGNDPWQEYEKYLDRYYFLSEQPFDKIECQVVLPEVEQMFKEQERQLEEMTKGAAEMNPHLSDFRMTYSKKEGLSFKEPSLELNIKPGGEIKDPQKFESGKQTMVHGFNQTIQGAIQIIRTVFGDYKKPDKNTIALISADISGGKAQIRYNQEGLENTRVCEESHCTTSGKNAQLQVQSEEDYTKIGDKLAIQTATGTVKQAGTEMQMKMNIKYQQVGNLFFPSEISSEFQTQVSSVKSEGKFNVQFQNVQVK